MSKWDRWGDFPSGPKLPPPEHGIKMKKAGTTWWGQRWIEALQQVLSGDAGRLARGRTYARAGRVHDLVVDGGEVTAKVTGSSAEPYEIEITLSQLADDAWARAIAGMAAKAQFAAELLAGQMPKEIDEVFRSGETSLFPRRRAELVATCSCPDWGDPCKHVAAAHYVLGEALDRDPFLLFELRGRTKTRVLEALRAARSGQPTEAAPQKRGRKIAATAERPAHAASEVPTVTLGDVAAADYDRAREALPTLTYSFDAPTTHGAVLRQLGTPGAWTAAASPAEALSPLLRRAAEAARRIALADPEPALAPDDDSPSVNPPAKPRRARR